MPRGVAASTRAVTRVVSADWPNGRRQRPRATPCGGEVLRVCLKTSRTKTNDVTPCRTSPPKPFVRTCLARNTRCNTILHLTAAGCKRQSSP